MDIIFAKEAPIAVILRRDDYGNVQMIRWDTDTDRTEIGQWISAKVSILPSGLSPNGEHLAAFFMDEREEKRRLAEKAYGLKLTKNSRGWLAVSRVPFFTAFALWFLGTPGRKGVRWQDDHHLEVDIPKTAEEAIAPPPKVSKCSGWIPVR